MVKTVYIHESTFLTYATNSLFNKVIGRKTIFTKQSFRFIPTNIHLSLHDLRSTFSKGMTVTCPSEMILPFTDKAFNSFFIFFIHNHKNTRGWGNPSLVLTFRHEPPDLTAQLILESSLFKNLCISFLKLSYLKCNLKYWHPFYS